LANSKAVVSLERPERYAKQLASHLGHKIEAVQTDSGWQLDFGIGHASLVCEAATLTMSATAANVEDLEKIQFVLDKHLRKFTTKLGELDIQFSQY
jgi:hypothetical protein